MSSSWTYTNTYLKSIPQAQRKRLLDILSSETQDGEVLTLAEYEKRLASKMTAINGKLPAPDFKLRKQAFRSLTSSANFNDMESRGIQALKILYNEAVLLESAIADQSNLVSTYLNDINNSILALDHEIDILELIAANSDGYTTYMSHSFVNGDLNRQIRGSNVGTSPFTLPLLDLIDPAYDADTSTRTLCLPIESNLIHKIAAARLVNQTPSGEDAYTTTEDVPTEEKEFSLGKLVDASPDTYWAETIQIDTLSTNVAETDLEIDLAGTQQINYIKLLPFTRFPYEITSITYYRNKNSSDGISLTGPSYPVQVTGEVNLSFSNIYAERLSFHIKQNNYSALRYVVNNVDRTINQLFDIASSKQTDISSELKDPQSIYFAMSSNMKALLSIDKERLTDTQTVDVYEFLYGIKRLEIGLTRYKNLGLYVSLPSKIELLGVIGLEAEEDIPSLTSIEYELLVKQYTIEDGQETLTASSRYDILPAGISLITDEVLDGDENIAGYWEATTRFPIENIGTYIGNLNITIKRNDVEMSASEWQGSVLSDGRVTIKIYNSALPLASRNTSIFTASYIPSSLSYVVALSETDYSEVFIRILLRNLTSNGMTTPQVRNYSMKFKKYTGS
jgi:hypothetical protein